MSKLASRIDVDVTCREWLRLNGYEDIARLVDRLMRKWKDEENGTRRNWFGHLAGTKAGRPCRIKGVELPIIKAFRRRCGYPPDVPNALERSPHELAPPIRKQKRWRGSFKGVFR